MEWGRMLQYVLFVVGAVVLYVAWGNGEGVLGLGEQCYDPNPKGLHLDDSYQLVYESQLCSAQVYQYGRLTFVVLTVVGLAAVGYASLLFHRRRTGAFAS